MIKEVLCNNDNIGDMINYFKSISGDQEYTGLNLIVGGWSVHLLECEASVMTYMLRNLNETAQQPNSLYT
jgi:hypothetical protein